jgi:hypothetical protein
MRSISGATMSIYPVIRKAMEKYGVGYLGIHGFRRTAGARPDTGRHRSSSGVVVEQLNTAA